MEFTYYIDELLGISHAAKHGVSGDELQEFFALTIRIQRLRKDESFISYGQLSSGRYLAVAFRSITKGHQYIITAYDLEEQEIIDKLDDLTEDRA